MPQAWGRSGIPEIFYQPVDGAIAAEIDIQQTMAPDVFTKSLDGVKVAEISQNEMGAGISVAYGLSDQVAVRASWGYELTDGKSKATQGGVSPYKGSGMTDMGFALLGFMPFSTTQLHFGIEMDSSPSSHTVAAPGVEGNEMSGGASVVSYLGGVYVLGVTEFAGFKATYISRADRSESTGPNGESYKVNGGQGAQYEGYYQFSWAEIEFDTRGGLALQSELTRDLASGATNRSAMMSPFVLLGAQYQILSNANLRLQYVHTMVPEVVDASYTYSTYNHGVLHVRLRMEF